MPRSAATKAHLFRFVLAVACAAVVGLAGCSADDAAGPEVDATTEDSVDQLETATKEPQGDAESSPAGNTAADAPGSGETLVPLHASSDDVDAVIDRVIDGDSVELAVGDSIVEARLIGINAPELADCQGPASADALETLAGGQGVTVIDYGFDRFDRQLVNLVIDGQSVNETMVASGWALGQHTDEHPDADAWVGAMIDAADYQRGMWNMPQECPSAEAALRITDAQANPPGPDDEVLDQEWIELTNLGDQPVDLAGWILRDESTSNRLELPSVQLEPEATLRVVTGCGSDSAGVLHWCSDYGVWSNQGETALLLGPSGAIEDWALL